MIRLTNTRFLLVLAILRLRIPNAILRLVDMEFCLDDRAEGAGATGAARSVTCFDGNVLAGEDGNLQVHSSAWCGLALCLGRPVGALVTLWLHDPAFFVSKHALVQHHALIEVLPIHGDHLDTSTPKQTRVGVGAVDSSASREGTHEIRLVVGEHFMVLLLVELKDAVLAYGEYVWRLLGLWSPEAFVVLAARIYGQVPEVLADVDFSTLGLRRNGTVGAGNRP